MQQRATTTRESTTESSQQQHQQHQRRRRRRQRTTTTKDDDGTNWNRLRSLSCCPVSVRSSLCPTDATFSHDDRLYAKAVSIVNVPPLSLSLSNTRTYTYTHTHHQKERHQKEASDPHKPTMHEQASSGTGRWLMPFRGLLRVIDHTVNSQPNNKADEAFLGG